MPALHFRIAFAVGAWLLAAPAAWAAAVKKSSAAQGSSDWISGELPELLLRLARGFSLLFFIVCVCNILVGAFQQMNSSGKDEVVKGGRKMMFLGFCGAVFAIAVYYASSAALAKQVTP